MVVFARVDQCYSRNDNILVWKIIMKNTQLCYMCIDLSKTGIKWLQSG